MAGLQTINQSWQRRRIHPPLCTEVDTATAGFPPPISSLPAHLTPTGTVSRCFAGHSPVRTSTAVPGTPAGPAPSDG